MMERSAADPARGRRAEQKAARRERIHAAARALFVDRGYDATSLDDIAAVAGVARGTFFNYFPSKAAVLAEQYQRLAEEFVALHDASVQGTAREKLASLFRGAEALLRREGDFASVIYHQAFREPEVVAADAGTEARVFERWVQWFEEAKQRGELSPGADSALLATVIMDVWFATLRAWIAADRRFGLADLVAEKLGLLFDGVAST
ncbi:TetR/AcrR family transcriptional regulator [Longimicrobium sp.]|jgi:AcrR family transcriptional regulator|uniref:TetR/AcrR family transcriptional regulator n=1 Tax=Longimicrobium sp. TaxID=2029185 RepID=UPI002ED98B1E